MRQRIPFPDATTRGKIIGVSAIYDDRVGNSFNVVHNNGHQLTRASHSVKSFSMKVHSIVS